LITFGAGYEFWKFTLPGGITAGALFELLMYGGSLIASLPVAVYNIYRYYYTSLLFYSFTLIYSFIFTELIVMERVKTVHYGRPLVR